MLNNPLIKKEENLIHHISHIDGIIFSYTPTFVVNWDTMEIYPQGYIDPNDPNDTGKSHGINKSTKFSTIENVVEFVEKNKHQIIIYEFKKVYWSEELLKELPRPEFAIFLKYTRKPTKIL